MNGLKTRFLGNLKFQAKIFGSVDFVSGDTAPHSGEVKF